MKSQEKLSKRRRDYSLRYIIIITLCFIINTKGFSQAYSPVVDEVQTKILIQNGASRGIYEKLIQDYAEKHEKTIRGINTTYYSITIARENIYKHLTTINQTLSQIEDVKHLSNYATLTFAKIYKLGNIIRDDPKALIAMESYVHDATLRIMGVRDDVLSIALNKNVLMNANERDQMIWETIKELKLINGSLDLAIYSVTRLNNTKRPLIPVMEWINKDLRVAKGIIDRSKWL